MRRYESWGRFPRVTHRQALVVSKVLDLPRLDQLEDAVLPYGRGRSYGDVCLNDGHTLIDTSRLNRLLRFEPGRGLLQCEAGATLGQILSVVVPQGWFLPVVPGTQHVSVGGAIANDVHGKNHHRTGTFGGHVRWLELLRSDGSRTVCSPAERVELFTATVGGLGLTGLITCAELQLKAVPGSTLQVEHRAFSSLAQCLELFARFDETHEYTVAWIDGLANGQRRGRGVLMAGNHAEGAGHAPARRLRWVRVPVELPWGVVGRFTVRALNWAYRRLAGAGRRRVHYGAFFFPLDAIPGWNLLYGPGGLLQYQCLLPPGDHEAAMGAMLDLVGRSDQVAALVTLKAFGSVPPKGLLSFARRGFALAIDLPHRGPTTLALLDRLDAVVSSVGGIVNPAKDARLSATRFQQYYPGWRDLARMADPSFSSSFWRRVTGGSTALRP